MKIVVFRKRASALNLLVLRSGFLPEPQSISCYYQSEYYDIPALELRQSP